MQIRPYEQRDLEAVVDLSLRAWAPVFVSIEAALSPEVYQEFYPDWRVSQRNAVEAACADEAYNVWVGDDRGLVVAFVAVKIHSEQLGEIHMLAVDPQYQRRGMGVELTRFALAWLASEGIAIAMVETGCDPGHAPARRTYEKCGFDLLPAARYFKKL